MNPLIRSIRYFLCLFLFIFCTSLCSAETRNPPEVMTYIGNKAPLGSGSVSSLLFKLYDISIWTKGDRWSWNQPFVLHLKYARNFSSQTIVDATIREMKSLETLDNTTVERDKKVFASLFPNVNAGDTISAVYLPNNILIFYYNSHKIGSIKNMQLAKQFLNIWLSPRASHTDLRNEIINR